MNYTFDRHEPLYDRMVFVLSLDMKKKKERILIGDESRIAQCLKTGNPEHELFYDKLRPLGTLLATFQPDSARSWDVSGFQPLWNALHSNRWKQPAFEKTAADFFKAQWEQGEPLSIYTALRLWEGYLRARLPRDRERAAEAYECDIRYLKDVLMDATESDMLSLDRTGISSYAWSPEDMHLDLWYPASDPSLECVVCYHSFLPLIAYYHNRLKAQGLVFRKCRICGKNFLAKSLRYSLCSEKCRKVQNRQNKRDFDARAKENSYDRIYKNECQHWRNVIHTAEKTSDFPPERLSAMKSAFADFKKEALARKSEVKNGTMTVKEFEDWILLKIPISD